MRDADTSTAGPRRAARPAWPTPRTSTGSWQGTLQRQGTAVVFGHRHRGRRLLARDDAQHRSGRAGYPRQHHLAARLDAQNGGHGHQRNTSKEPFSPDGPIDHRELDARGRRAVVDADARPRQTPRGRSPASPSRWPRMHRRCSRSRRSKPSVPDRPGKLFTVKGRQVLTINTTTSRPHRLCLRPATETDRRWTAVDGIGEVRRHRTAGRARDSRRARS